MRGVLRDLQQRAVNLMVTRRVSEVELQVRVTNRTLAHAAVIQVD